jgi:hypothetical protein
MNLTLLKALLALVPVIVLVIWSGVAFFRSKTVFSFLQLAGSGCLVGVVLAHVCEALHLLPQRAGVKNTAPATTSTW